MEYGVSDFRWMLKQLNLKKKEREEEQAKVSAMMQQGNQFTDYYTLWVIIYPPALDYPDPLFQFYRLLKKLKILNILRWKQMAQQSLNWTWNWRIPTVRFSYSRYVLPPTMEASDKLNDSQNMLWSA